MSPRQYFKVTSPVPSVRYPRDSLVRSGCFCAMNLYDMALETFFSMLVTVELVKKKMSPPRDMTWSGDRNVFPKRTAVSDDANPEEKGQRPRGESRQVYMWHFALPGRVPPSNYGRWVTSSRPPKIST